MSVCLFICLFSDVYGVVVVFAVNGSWLFLRLTRYCTKHIMKKQNLVLPISKTKILCVWGGGENVNARKWKVLNSERKILRNEL